MELDVGTPAAATHHLDITPVHATAPSAQRLHYGLLGGEPGSQLRCPAPTVIKLGLGVDTAKKTLTPPLHRLGDALYLNDVHSHRVHGWIISIHRKGVYLELPYASAPYAMIALYSTPYLT